MKDPIQEYERQGEKLNEIFGFLKRTFGSKSDTTPASFLDAMKRYKDTDTDADCAKMDVGKKINRKVGGTSGGVEITIGNNKIKNIKGLRFELLDNKGKGTGKFDNAIVNDFKCYDLDKDIYGIKWLFDDKVSYEAETISGDLSAHVKNQSLNFKGKWNEGIFYGKFLSGPDDFKGIPAKTATFAFFNFGKSSATTATTKKKKGKRKAKTTKKGATATVAPISPVAGATTPVRPMTVGSVAPASATIPTPTAPAGTPSPKTGKGTTRKKIKVSESRVPTMKEFLQKFL